MRSLSLVAQAKWARQWGVLGVVIPKAKEGVLNFV